MKSPLRLALVALSLAAGAAFGQEISTEAPIEHASSLTRSEVRADVLGAVARGERLSAGEANVIEDAAPRSGPTRAQVQSDVRRVVAAGARLSAGEASFRRSPLAMNVTSDVNSAAGTDLRYFDTRRFALVA